MNGDILGLAWWNRHLEAVRLKGSRVLGRWSTQLAGNDLESFRTGLLQARESVGFTGRRTVLVLEHRRLIYGALDTPSAQGRTLDQVLEHLVAEQKYFDEPAVWSRVPLPATGPQRRWLLAVLPRSFRDHLDGLLAEQELELVGLYPFAAVQAEYLQQVEGDPAEALVLVQSLAGSHALLVGRPQGQILFARSLVESSSDDSGRLAQEIQRTQHFCQQRFGLTVHRVIHLPAGVDPTLEPSALDGSVPSMADANVATWAVRAARWGGSGPWNLAGNVRTPVSGRQRALGLASLALLLVAVLTAALVEWGVQARGRRAEEMQRQERERTDRAALEAVRVQAWDRRQRWLSLVGDAAAPNVAPAFARYLCQVMPESLCLTRLDLVRAETGWELRLEGVTRESSSGQFRLLEAWEAELAGGPFQVRIADSTQRRMLGQAPLPMSGALAGPAASVSGWGGDQRRCFLVGHLP